VNCTPHPTAQAHPVAVVQSVSGSDAAAIGGAVLVLQSELAILNLPTSS